MYTNRSPFRKKTSKSSNKQLTIIIINSIITLCAVWMFIDFIYNFFQEWSDVENVKLQHTSFDVIRLDLCNPNRIKSFYKIEECKEWSNWASRFYITNIIWKTAQHVILHFGSSVGSLFSWCPAESSCRFEFINFINHSISNMTMMIAIIGIFLILWQWGKIQTNKLTEFYQLQKMEHEHKQIAQSLTNKQLRNDNSEPENTASLQMQAALTNYLATTAASKNKLLQLNNSDSSEGQEEGTTQSPGYFLNHRYPTQEVV